MRNFSQGIIEKSVTEGDGKDVMSVLLRANESEDPRSRLSESEIVAQIAYVEPNRQQVVYLLALNRTILFAGHDTTASTLAWYLYEIARNSNCQERDRGHTCKKTWRDTISDRSGQHDIHTGDSEGILIL